MPGDPPPFGVCIETPSGSSLVEAMRTFRSWFDRCRIQPTLFQAVFRDGAVEFEVYFRTEDEAELFRQEFGGVATL